MNLSFAETSGVNSRTCLMNVISITGPSGDCG